MKEGQQLRLFISIAPAIILSAVMCVHARAEVLQKLPQAVQCGSETIEGRSVVRFEHDCLKDWGYTENIRQYFYVVEPKIKGSGPLMVCLHSAGANPDKFENGRLEMPPNVTKVNEAGDDFTGLVVNSGNGSDWWWGAEEINANSDKYSDSLTPAETRILATIEWVVRQHNIDRNRIYLRGISMGGSGTLGIGMNHGDIFAALLAAELRLVRNRELGSSIDIPAQVITDITPRRLQHLRVKAGKIYNSG